MKMIVYYSLSGKTQQLAQALAAATGAETLRIKDEKSRRGFFGFIRSGYESATGRPGQIKTLEPPLDAAQFAAFDGVILMGPTWAGSLCSPLRAFLMQYGAAIGKYAMIMTCGDETRPLEKTLTAVSQLCGKPAVYHCSISSPPADYAARVTKISSQLVKLLK